MLPPKIFLSIVGLCLLFGYSSCDGPALATCSTNAECTIQQSFCDAATSCKCNAGYFPYKGDTAVENTATSLIGIKCINIAVCRPGFGKCNSHGDCYRNGDAFRCVCDYGYSGVNCEIDSYATTTPRFTVTTKSPRGIGNFLPFLAIPGVGMIIIIIIIIIIFLPMSG